MTSTIDQVKYHDFGTYLQFREREALLPYFEELFHLSRDFLWNFVHRNAS